MVQCDIAGSDGSDKSYMIVPIWSVAAEISGFEVGVMRSHEKYRNGFFVSAIEKSLENIEPIRKILERCRS